MKIYMHKNAFLKINSKEKTFAADKKLDINLSKYLVEFVKDNDILKFGKLEFKVIETKGHTDCSISFLLNNKYLFTGDTLFKNGIGRTDLPTSSDEELNESLKKIFKLDDKIAVYPGHGKTTKIKDERGFLPFN